MTLTGAGMSDPNWNAKKTIVLNGVDVGTQGRGFHVAIVFNRTVLKKGAFDTHGSTAKSAELVEFINSSPNGSVVLAATHDSAASCLTVEAKAYFIALGSAYITSLGLRHSLALISAKGVPKPSWFAEKYASYGNGPVTISQLLP